MGFPVCQETDGTSWALRAGATTSHWELAVVAACLIPSPAAWLHGRPVTWKKAERPLTTCSIFPDDPSGPGTRSGRAVGLSAAWLERGAGASKSVALRAERRPTVLPLVTPERLIGARLRVIKPPHIHWLGLGGRGGWRCAMVRQARPAPGDGQGVTCDQRTHRFLP